jgi:hypothetical protein
MPAARAERFCPGVVFVPPDFTRHRAVSRSVREIFKRHTDLIEHCRWTKRTWTLQTTRSACRPPRLWHARFANKFAGTEFDRLSRRSPKQVLGKNRV